MLPEMVVGRLELSCVIQSLPQGFHDQTDQLASLRLQRHETLPEWSGIRSSPCARGHLFLKFAGFAASAGIERFRFRQLQPSADRHVCIIRNLRVDACQARPRTPVSEIFPRDRPE